MKRYDSGCYKSKKEIFLGTSLAPQNIEWQQECVKSWIENGFGIVSCNTKTEIEKLQPYFEGLDIEFIETENNAYSISGKNLPFVKDTLLQAAERSSSVCGFLNADIYISHMPDAMYDFICKEAKKSLVFVRRNEIDDIQDIDELNWDIHFDGIDLFFVDKEFAGDIIEEEFYVQSIWDLSLLFKAQLLKIPIKELRNPIAFHKRHTIKWNFEDAVWVAERFCRKNFTSEENAYGLMLKKFYHILFSGSESICFCRDDKYSCMFVADGGDEELINSIYNQDYPHIAIRHNDEGKEKFDFVFYMDNRTILDKMFTRSIIFIMQEFNCSRLKLGNFFISQIEGEERFNELVRNFKLLKHINEECDMGINVVKICSEHLSNDIVKKIYIPIVYEKMDIYDEKIFAHYQIQNNLYIAPAGVRGCEWYYLYHNRLDSSVKFQGYLDNNPEKIGKKMFGYEVRPMSCLKDEEVGYVIIASKYYSLELHEQVSGMIEKSKILDASCICEIDSKGVTHSFDLSKYKELRK